MSAKTARKMKNLPKLRIVKNGEIEQTHATFSVLQNIWTPSRQDK